MRAITPAGWETSHLMALHPETVDLSLLPPKGEPLIGVGGRMAPQDATAEFGAEILQAAARYHRAGSAAPAGT